MKLLTKEIKKAREEDISKKLENMKEVIRFYMEHAAWEDKVDEYELLDDLLQRINLRTSVEEITEELSAFLRNLDDWDDCRDMVTLIHNSLLWHILPL